MGGAGHLCDSQDQAHGVDNDEDDDDDGYDADVSNTSSVDPQGDYRLAWMFVEGWRQRLQVAGDVIQKHKWEWRMGDRLSSRRRSTREYRPVPREEETP